MPHRRHAVSAVYAAFALFLVALVLLVPACGSAGDQDTIYQVSTLQALLEGVYDGPDTVGELKNHGDIGLGTFDALDGEMMVLDGTVYQIRETGKVHIMPDSAHTPFACVTYFEADETLPLPPKQVVSYATFKTWLDGQLTTKNLPYTIRIDGEFSYVKTRAAPKQHKPYRRLVEALKVQPEFEFKNVRGTIVGFRLPKFLAGVNATGYHLHFLTADRKAGGHLLEFHPVQARVQLDTSPKLLLSLPTTGPFAGASIDNANTHEIEQVESNRK